MHERPGAQCRKRALMVAFHYPPYTGSSGVHRTLSFSRDLPARGWQPIVLTVHPRVYPRVHAASLADVPPEAIVHRAWGLDAATDLAIGGRYVRWTALPDRWLAWLPAALVAGLALVRRHRPAVLWSTYPIATAHLIGLLLHRLTGLPWIADFRDSMTEDCFPSDPVTRRSYLRIERQTVRRCSRAVFTTPGTRRMYAERYPGLPADRWAVIPNGYDERSLADAEASTMPQDQRQGATLRLVHSGALYRSERDPRCLFAALAALLRDGRLAASDLRVVFRGADDEPYYRELTREHRVEQVVAFEPALPHREALRELFEADGLLVLQAANCNHQVPAKIYEYLRCRRPILALTDPAGDTAAVLREAGMGTFAALDNTAEIADALVRFVTGVRRGEQPRTARVTVERYSRAARASELVGLLDELAGTDGSAS